MPKRVVYGTETAPGVSVTSAPETVVIITIGIWLDNCLYLNLWRNEEKMGAFEKLGIKTVPKGFTVFQNMFPTSPGNAQEFSLRCREKQRHPLAGLILSSGETRRARCDRLLGEVAWTLRWHRSAPTALRGNCHPAGSPEYDGTQLIHCPPRQSYSFSVYHWFLPRPH